MEKYPACLVLPQPFVLPGLKPHLWTCTMSGMLHFCPSEIGRSSATTEDNKHKTLLARRRRKVSPSLSGLIFGGDKGSRKQLCTHLASLPCCPSSKTQDSAARSFVFAPHSHSHSSRPVTSRSCCCDVARFVGRDFASDCDLSRSIRIEGRLPASSRHLIYARQRVTLS